MSNLFKRFIFNLFLLSLILLPISANSVSACSTPNTNYASIVPSPLSLPLFENKWAGFFDITTNLKISSKGRADYFTSCIPLKSSYYVTITVKLQRYKSGSWSTLFSGTTKGKDFQLYDNSHYVKKGYKYRTRSTLKVYKSKGGSLINSETINSTTRKY